MTFVFFVIYYYPNFNKQLVLTNDSSNYGIDAVLSQLDKNNTQRPIYFASQILTTLSVNNIRQQKKVYFLQFGQYVTLDRTYLM